MYSSGSVCKNVQIHLYENLLQYEEVESVSGSVKSLEVFV